jgi:outer membrane receptor protein involved in Fe transport
MKKIFVFACLLLWSHCSFAQYRIEGTTSDTSGSPVFSATAVLTKKDSSVVQLSKTDSLGHFVFKNIPESNYNLIIFAIGYTKKILPLTVKSNKTLHIVLKPLARNLSAITVVGSKPIVEHKADRIVFNVNKSISAKGSSGLDILKKAPGVKIGSKTISLSGKGTLGVMVNGRLLHLSGKALLDYLKSYAASQVSSIEIITHPSAKYDAEGNSGLINIITRENTKAGFSGTISGSVKRFLYHNQPDYKGIKNYGDVNGSIGLNYNSKKWRLYANGSYKTGREIWGYGIAVHYPEKYWAMQDTGEYRIPTANVLAGADYKVTNRTTLGVEYNYVNHVEAGADYVHTPVYNTAGRLDSTLKTFATYHPIAQSNAINLHLIQELGHSGAKLTLNTDYFNYFRTDRSDLITHSYNGKGNLIEENTRALHDTTTQNINIYTFKADVEIPASFAQFSLGSKLSFINNYSNIYYYDKADGRLILDNDLSNEFRYIENTQALYATISKDLKKWKLNAGLRPELTQTKAISYKQDQKLRKYYLKLFPSVSIIYELNNNHQLSVKYNKRIHRPTFWDMNPYKSFMTAYSYVEGNPYLEPAYITNIQLSHRYKYLLTSSLYMNMINNGFSRVIKTHDEGNYTHTTTKLNFIKSQRYGISESLHLQPSWWVESSDLLRGYYTKVRSDIDYIDGRDGLGLYLESKNTFYFSRDKTVRGFLGFWYQFPEIDHFGRADAYYSVNMGLEWSPPEKNLSLSLNYNDLFKSSASRVHTIVDQIRNTYTNFQLNSQIRFSVTWHFGSNNSAHNPTETSNKAERSRVN